MEKKRKLVEAEIVENNIVTNSEKKKKKKKNKELNESTNEMDNSTTDLENDVKPEASESTPSQENGIESRIVKTEDSANQGQLDGDGITTPTTKRPPRNSGETKRQYKRRIRSLREAGLLIDPPVVEKSKTKKRNPNKSRKEKRDKKTKDTEELDKFRSIVQINYLKHWKNEPSKWKFNKNVQGKLLKHMFNSSRIPDEIFEILIEYLGTSKSVQARGKVTKKCSDIVESMEKWTSASEEEKKKLTEPNKETYNRARQVLQNLT